MVALGAVVAVVPSPSAELPSIRQRTRVRIRIADTESRF